MVDTKLSSLSFGTTSTLFYGEEGGASKKYSGMRVYNVKDFGALGDNVNDDRAACQMAIDSASSDPMGGGGIVWFPAGTYRIGSITSSYGVLGGLFPIAHAVNLVLVGTGGATLIGSFSGYIIDRFMLLRDSRLFIRDLSVVNQSFTGGGIRLLDTDGSMIENCFVQAGTFGINLGGRNTVNASSFTGNSSGTTTLNVSAFTGGPIYADQFPLKINGTGIDPNNCYIIAFGTFNGISGTGTVITNIPTTLSNVTVTPFSFLVATAFTTTVNNCKVNGHGSYNANPALSFIGIGVQMSNETIVQNSHIDNCAVAIRAYGDGNTITGCQMESNTTATLFGIDSSGTSAPTTSLFMGSCTFEGNMVDIDMEGVIGSVIVSCNTSGENDSNHNSTYALFLNSVQGLVVSSCKFGGSYSASAVYLNGGGPCRRIRFECSESGGIGHNAANLPSSSFANITICQTTGMQLAYPLSELYGVIAAGDVAAAYERRFINDATLALGSQPYGALAVGGGSNLASVWWDFAGGAGGGVRYG